MTCEIKGRFCGFSRHRNISTQCIGGGCGTCQSIIFLTGITARRCHHSQVRTVPWTTFFNGDDTANKQTAATLLSGMIAWPVSMPHRRANVRDRFLIFPSPPAGHGFPGEDAHFPGRGPSALQALSDQSTDTAKSSGSALICQSPDPPQPVSWTNRG